MTYVFDIDGTVCTNASPYYEKAVPFADRIEKINSLYDSGHMVVCYIYVSRNGLIKGITTICY